MTEHSVWSSWRDRQGWPLTEFLPILSTGHLMLLVDLLGFKGPLGRVFKVVFLVGAIFGVCWVYEERLVRLKRKTVCGALTWATMSKSD